MTEILDPFINFFIKLIQNLATPVAFISFLAFIINTNGFLHFDRQSKKTSLKFLLTSVIAILTTFFVFAIAVVFLSYLNILDLQLVLTKDPSGIKGFFGLSLGEILTNSLPNNILEIFTLANPIPMLMTAIILGWGINAFSNQNNMRICNGINAVMDLTCRLINKIFNLTPAFLFIAVVDIGLYQSYMGTFSETFLAFAVGFLLVLIAFLTHYLVYIVELIIAGCSPIRFFRKYKDMLSENFRIASNFDAKPCNIRLFRRKLKDPSKETPVRNILDIGANMNMDGNCIIISAAVFMFQLMSGSAINIFTLIELMLIILLLGAGSPNQPGSFTIAMLVLLKFLNLSADFFPALIVLEALFCKLYSSTNAIGDIVTVAIIADDDLKRQKSRLWKGNGC